MRKTSNRKLKKLIKHQRTMIALYANESNFNPLILKNMIDDLQMLQWRLRDQQK